MNTRYEPPQVEGQNKAPLSFSQNELLITQMLSSQDMAELIRIFNKRKEDKCE